MILIWSEEKLPFFFIKSVELSENTSSDEDQTNCVCVCVYIHMQILKMRLKWVKLDSCDSAFSWSATSNQIKPSLKSFCEFDVCQRAETLQIWTYSSYSIMFSAITITCILFLPFLTLTSRDMILIHLFLAPQQKLKKVKLSLKVMRSWGGQRVHHLGAGIGSSCSLLDERRRLWDSPAYDQSMSSENLRWFLYAYPSAARQERHRRPWENIQRSNGGWTDSSAESL